MSTTASAYPLQWPHGWPRTPRQNREYGQFKGTLDAVRREMLFEIDALILGKAAARQTMRQWVTISTNMPLRRDGEPMANARPPEDTGVAVYFHKGEKPVCFACDKYDAVWKNMRGIQKTIEALRGIERWGSSQLLERAFTGFAALPASTAAGWPTVLGLDSMTATVEAVKDKYRGLSKIYHPDGAAPDADKLHLVQEAYRDAMQQLTGHLRPCDAAT